ncbi:MAG: ComEA family DNA-binding protein [Mangrovibacterium sp.]
MKGYVYFLPGGSLSAKTGFFRYRQLRKIVRNIKGLLVVPFFFTDIGEALSQAEPLPSGAGLELLLEDYLAGNESGNTEQLLQELQYVLDRPLDINRAGEADLAVLPFLSPVQIRSLIRYRKQFGAVFSAAELVAVPGFDEQLAKLTGMFVQFGSGSRSVLRMGGGRTELLFRWGRLLEKQAAYRDPVKYEGSPDRFYLRGRYTSSRIEAGFTGEKDPGESFFSGTNSGRFDFYSGYLRFTGSSGKQTAILGDYVVQFGQGLAAWQGFSLGKSADVCRVANFRTGIKPHTSAEENNFMRGFAACFQWRTFRFSPFFSWHHVDANLDEQEGRKVVTNLQSGGYHRTEGERFDKHAEGVMTTGGNMAYEGERLALGLTALHVNYAYPLVRGENGWNRYLYQGSGLSCVSLDARFGLNRWYLFGELATGLNGGWAAVGGLTGQPAERIELSALIRCMGKRYSNPLSSSFTEGSQVNDESGVYLGVRMLPLAGIRIKSYVDLFRFNHVKYTTAGAGDGREFLFQLELEPASDWQLYARYFYECKPVKLSGLYSVRNIDQIRQSVRLNLSRELSRSFSLKSRFEQSFYRHDHKSSGFLVCQDLGYHPENVPVRLWCRVAYFQTADYDSRIYAYENDLLYQFSVPALYGEGIRSYVTGKVKIGEKAEFWYKLSRSWFLGAETVGSGNSLIEGNKRTEVKIQIRLKI